MSDIESEKYDNYDEYKLEGGTYDIKKIENNLIGGDFPAIKDKDFYKKIKSRFKKYEVPKKKKTFRQICFPKDFNLQIPQQFLAKYINPKTPYKGVLVFHQIGAGKTCTAVNIAEQWKHHRNIIVVTPASLIGNFRDELRSPCAGNNYLTIKERKQLRKLNHSSDEFKEIMERSEKRIDKYYKVYSYNKFVDLFHTGKLNLRNSVLIVDEIQNMVSEGGTFYHALHRAIKTGPKELRVVLLSATPMFDQPIEIALTMNLLPLPAPLPIGREFVNTFIHRRKRSGKYHYSAKNLDIFKERLKGFISYFRGAPPYAFPEAKILFTRVKMKKFQYKSYLTVLANENKDGRFDKLKSGKIFEDGDIVKIPNSFFLGSRLMSNIAFPNRCIDERGLKSLTEKEMVGKNLKKYSIKFYTVLRRLKRQGKSFVYSNFTSCGGIHTFVKILEANGYKDYKTNGVGRKRFAIFSGDEKKKYKEEIKKVYNNINNLNGSNIKVILISPSGKEGLSLKGVQNAHILEPYWNHSRMLQIFGRANRYCSHKDLPEEKRKVKIYVYLATHDKEDQSIDEYIYKLAMEKHRLISEFELALKESAVDCNLFKNANVYKNEDEEDIACKI